MTITQTLTYWLDSYWRLHGDPRVESYFMMGSIRSVLLIIGCYLAFVLYFGPRLMQNRPPYQLKAILLVYNVIMSIANLQFFLHLFVERKEVWQRICDVKFPDIKANLNNEYELNKIWYTHLYMMSKFVDLLDTIFFVLRKKTNQITALHVYHHFSVAFFGWVYFRLNGVNSLMFPFAFMNTFVHTLMYAYYGLSALGPWIQPYLWWKRYITQLQLLQFVVMGAHGLYFILNQRGYPPVLIYNLLAQAMLYFVLFLRFYLKTYNSPTRFKAESQQNVKKNKAN